MTPPVLYGWIGQVGGGLVELPMELARDSVAWQPVHGQPTWGGMGESAPVLWPEGFEERRRNPFIRFLRAVTRDPVHAPPFEAKDVAALRVEGFRWVVLDRRLVESEVHGMQAGPFPPERLPFEAGLAIADRLGAPAAVDGHLVAWDLEGGATPPGDLQPSADALEARTWTSERMPEYEAHLRALGRVRDGR
jgi:hypothetical protein